MIEDNVKAAISIAVSDAERSQCKKTEAQVWALCAIARALAFIGCQIEKANKIAEHKKKGGAE